MILAKAFLRRADGADNFGPQVLFAANPVVDFFRERIVKQPVHREIATRGIGFGIGKHHRLRPAAILIVRLSAERGDLKLLPVFNHDNDAKIFADRNGFGEQLLHLLRPGIRGDVKILRRAAKQKITHTAAHPERREARRLQAGNDLSGIFTGRQIHKTILTQRRKGAKIFCFKALRLGVK